MLIDSGVVTSSLSVSGSYRQTGNAVITGSLTVTGGITGSITTASYALNAELLDNLDSTAFLYTSSFNTFSSSYSTRVSNTEATASSLKTASGSFSTRVTNLENFSSSLDATFATDAELAAVSSSITSRLSTDETNITNLQTASGSFSTRVTNTEATASNLVPRVVNLEATASSLTTASGSFSTRVTGLETASGSFSTRVTNTEATASNLVPRVVNLEATASNIVPRVVNLEATASNLTTASGSFSTRVTNTEATASNLVPRVVNLEATASNVVPRVVNLETTASNLTTASGSFSTRVTTAETNITNLQTASGSFSTRVTNTEATASSLTTASGSFSSRVTTAETNITNLQTASGSFSTRITNEEATGSRLVTASGSFSTRVTGLETASGSFSTRVTTLENASASFATMSGSLSSRVTTAESNITSLQTASGSFSTRVTNTEATASSLITASGSASTRITNLETASGSFSTRTTNLETASGSFSTRVTNTEATASSLVTASGSASTRLTSLESASGSFSTRVTSAETNITNLQTASGSFSTRVTTAETNITNLQTASGSSSTRITNLESTASNFVNASSSLSIRVTSVEGSVSSLNSKTGSYATTGSNTFTGTQTVQGTIVAQTLNVQQVTSSIVYSSGSNIFGKLTTDVQQFTGSLRVSGSGDHWVMGGNVGIGTTSPSYRLDVAGDINISAGSNIKGGGVNMIGSDGSAVYLKVGTQLYIQSGATDLAVITTGGNVGIGTTNPSGKIDVYNADAWQRFVVTTTTQWGDGATPYITIGAGGASGIMFNNPHVVWNTTNSAAAIRMGRSGGSGGAYYEVGTGTSDSFFIAKNSYSAGTQFFISSSGNVGIGTSTPNYKLDVNGAGYFSGNTSNSYILTANQTNTTSGTSFGLLVRGGTNSSDSAFRVQNAAASVNLFSIQGDGNVGIGTASPSQKLDVSGSGRFSAGQPDVQLNITDASQYARLYFLESSVGVGGVQQIGSTFASGNRKNRLEVFGPTGGGISFIANGLFTAPAMHITGSNVGIGTTAPGANLEVYGSEIRIDSTGTKQVYLRNVGSGNTGSFVTDGYTRVGSNNSSVLGLMTNNVDRITILSGGSVGIGTSPTQATLHINGNVYATSYTGSFSGTFASPGSNTQMIYNNAGSLGAASNVYYYNNFVGINTTSPRYPLEVTGSGTGYNDRTLAIGNTANNGTFVYIGISKGSGGYGIIQAITTEGANYGDLILNPNGGSIANVGIGTTVPTAKLHISGASGTQLKIEGTEADIWLKSNGGGAGTWRILGSSSQDTKRFRIYDDDASLERFSINTNGNVGIGSTSPGVSLDVSGSGIRITNPTAPNFYLNNTTVQWKAYLTSAGSANFAISDAVRDVLTLGYNGAASYFQGGNVGINTTSPQAQLDVKSTASNINIYRATDSSNQYRWRVDQYFEMFLTNTSGTDTIKLGQSGSYFNSGNVGIGTTTANEKLVVRQTNANWSSVGLYTSASSGQSFGPLIQAGTTSADATLRVLDQTGGSSYLYVRGDGFVGINTSSPGARVDINVAGGSLSNSALSIRAGNAANTSGSNQIVFGYDGTLNYAHAIKTRHQSAAFAGNNIDFYTWNYGTDTLSTYGTKFVMTIEGSGNVGIGSKTPSQTLDVTGTGRFLSLIVDGASNSNNATISLTRTDSSWGIFNETDLRFYQTGSNNRYPGTVRMVLSSGGNLGVNTNFSGVNTAGLLTIKGANSGGNQIYIIQENDDRGWRFRAKNDGHFYLQSSYVGADTDILKINYDDGNVGIGTTSPNAKLSVQGNTNLGNSYGNTTSSTYTTKISGYALRYDASNRYGNYGVLILNSDDGWTSGARKYMLTSGLNATKFAIVRSADATTDPSIGGDGGSVSSGTADFVITNTGNVGIGTTDPSAKFQVNTGASITGATSGINGIRIVATENNGLEWFLSHGNGYNGWVANAKVNNVGSNWSDGYLEFCTSTTSGASLSTMALKNGNVGISTTTPSAKLNIVTSLSPYTSQSLFELTSEAAWKLRFESYHNGGGYDYRVVQNDNGPDINMITFKSGNIGIGATSPGAKLEVYNTSTTQTAAIKINNSSYTPKGYMGMLFNNFYITHGGTYSSGWSADGTNAVSAIVLGAADSDSSIVLQTTTTNGAGPLTRLTVDKNGHVYVNSGNIGISTTNPSSRLTIAPVAASNVSTIEFTNTDNAVISSYYSQTFAIDNTNAVGGRSFVFAKGAKGYGNQPSVLMTITGDSGAVMARSVNLSGAKVGDHADIGSLSGLVGWYVGDSYNATDKIWYDISGNANNAVGGGSPTKATFSGGVQNAYKSFSVVSGSTSDTLLWPSGILPSTYTLFHVTRYSGGTEGRIFTGYTTNWLSGFWSTNAGVAYHQGWITDQTDHFTTNWVLSTDQNSYYKGQSNASVYSATGGGGTSDRICINTGNNGEPSNFMVAEVIVFNRSLTTEEILYVETYLARKYGLPNNNNFFQGNINATGDIIAYFSSDAKLKDNINAIESPIEKISKINGVSFNWNDKQSLYEVGKKDYGVIAQEVEEVLPELVTTRDNGYKAVRYEKIVPLLIEAIKDQQHQIDELKYLLQNK